MGMDSGEATSGEQPSGGRIGPAVEILCVFGVASLVMAAGMPLVRDNPLEFQALAWLTNACMIGGIWLSLRRRGQGWRHIGLGPFSPEGRSSWNTIWKSLLVFAAAMVAFLLGAIVMVNITGRPEPADMTGYNYLSGNLPMLAAALVSVFLISSLGEEVIYRGFLITRITEAGGGGKGALRLAIAVSAIVFGLVHFAWGPMGIVQTTFMGLALGIAFLVLKRNLWILVLAHFYMDAILLVQMYLGPGA